MFTPRTIFFIFIISSFIALVIEGIFYLFLPKFSVIVNKFQRNRLDNEIKSNKESRDVWSKK